MNAGWFKSRQRELGVTSFDLGAALGRDRTVVARIYSGRQRMTLDQAHVFADQLKVPLAEVIERAGIAGRATAREIAHGFAEGDAAPWSPSIAARDSQDALLARALGLRPGVEVWTVNSACMSLAGFMPGDKIVVDTVHADEVRSGDAVLAQIYDVTTGSARTVFRQYQQPALVSHSPDRDDWRVHLVDKSTVAIVGVITASWRSRAA